MKIRTKSNYDKENDIFSMNIAGFKVEVSEEARSHKGHDYVIDYDREGRIVGIEIFNWNKRRKKK